MFKKFPRNPFFIFSPFLFYYLYIIIKEKWPSLYGDEIRYFDFAKNLLHGFYSPSAPHINLWSGPGYPIILMPYIALHIPALYITLMNGLYLYWAVVLLHKALRLLTNFKTATVLCVLLAIYPNALSILPILYTEAFTIFLVSSFILSTTLYYINQNKVYSFLAGITLGYLVLTKIIFGYVITVCLLVCLITLLLKKHNSNYLKALRILAIAFAISIPYLVYTYYMTGKIFYWGNSGGMSLYWMSTPYEQEYGDWKIPELTNKQYPTLFKSEEAVAMLRKNHSKEIKFILAHNVLMQDELFKQAAMTNIKQHPFKFIKNYYYNMSRMLFNFPYSYAYQDAAIVRNILIGSLILWSSVICLILTLINWNKVIFPVKFLLLITGVYLLSSGLLSAYPRQLDIIMPVLLFWFGYIIANLKRQDWDLELRQQIKTDN